MTTHHYTLHLWNFSTEFLVLFGLLQEVNELQNLKLGLFTSSNVIQPDINAASDHLCFGLGHPKDAVSSPVLESSSSPLPGAEHEQTKQRNQREENHKE